MDKISILKDYFQQRYLGRDSFLENVIFPIWGKENFEDKYDQEMVTEDLKTVANATGITSVTNVGEIGLPSCNDLYIYDIRVADRIKMMRNRVGIQQLIRRIMPTYSCAFMLFHYDNYDNWDWRFTFCRRGSRDELTDSKRFTFMLGPHQSCRTVAENFAKLMEKGEGADDKDIEGAFDVEALSDEFFTKYKQHYERFVEFITGKKFVKKGGKWEETVSHEPHAVYYPAFNCDDKLVRDYVKKLLGRIVFLHFLQKKGWLGVPENDSWGDGDQDFMLHLFENATDWQKDDFLDCVLEPLFSEALDTDRGKKSIFDTDVPIMGSTRMRIPYLNGGLFEKDECDKKNIQFPSELFQSLFNFLSQYNFTIDENDPDDAQVGVDPEMLGRIFENLLEDNKDKGAFYTPKEIVRYMCRQSLIAYLNTNITDEAKQKAIETFVKTYDVKALNDVDAHLAQQVDEQLKNVKICDPAIGSGAFPMGLLKELFLCRGAIENFDNAADIKRHIIQNNIYGVDIERGAVDIARLRFWLSLVVDETEPQTLPNLDFKIMQGNSLLESYQGEDLSKIAATKQEKAEGLQMTFFDDTLDVLRKQLNDKISQYYGEADHQKKAHLVAEIHDNIKQQLKDTGCSVDLSNINIQANDQFFLWHTWFSDVFNRPSDCNGGGGFDVVIGNPPYIKEYENRNAFDGFRENSPYYMGKMDLWNGFACHSIDLLNENGLLCYIAPNNWGTNKGAEKMRKKIIEETKILQLIDFSTYMVFGDSASIQTMIMLVRKDNRQETYSFDYRKLNSSNASKSDAMQILTCNLKEADYFTPQINKTYSQGTLLTFSNDEKDVILYKIQENAQYLIKEDLAQGIVFPQDFLNKKGQEVLGFGNVGDGIFGLSNSELNGLNLTSKEKVLIKPYFTTEQVHRYYTEKECSQWMIYTNSTFKEANSLDSYPHIKSHLDKYRCIFTSDNAPYGLHRARNPYYFEGEKILCVRKCPIRPIFSYADGSNYVTQTFFVIKTERFNLKYLTGLLNSKLIEFWLRNKGKMQGDNYQIDKEPLMQIPIKTKDSEERRIIKLVETILNKKEASIEADTSEEEATIDNFVYQIYGINPYEIKIIENK